MSLIKRRWKKEFVDSETDDAMKRARLFDIEKAELSFISVFLSLLSMLFVFNLFIVNKKYGRLKSL